MLEKTSPLTKLLAQLASGATTPSEVAAACVQRANGNASHNTYIHFSADDLTDQATSLAEDFSNPHSRPPLFSVPISLKDCFDMAGTVTTCGSRFYAEHTPPAQYDSAMATRLRASGALITGKTHMHALAYGITGENPAFGNCLQPRDATLLTGGSSSGAAASVQEGSALAAIGTDTGGSVRVPAVLCGLAGYRASHGLAYAPGPWPATPAGLWEGSVHLAEAFDAVGILLRDPRDMVPLAHALFGVPFGTIVESPRIGFAPPASLADSDPDALAAYAAWLDRLTAAGALLTEIDISSWRGSEDAFAGIQAHDAAGIHRGLYDHFDPPIAQRLRRGASLTPADLAPLEARRAALQSSIRALFDHFDFIMLPAAPVSRLIAGEDQSNARPRILRYTTPFSMAGLPVVSLPGEMIGAPLGTGVQIAAAPANDGTLLAYAGAIAQGIVDGLPTPQPAPSTPAA